MKNFQVLLNTHGWHTQDIISKYRDNSSCLHVRAEPPRVPPISSNNLCCPVCVAVLNYDRFAALSCGHFFCKDCWGMHFEIQIMQGDY